MQNVVTTQVRLFLRHHGDVPPIDVYMPLLYNSGRGSYHVPVHVRQNFIDPYIDIQFGAANYPDGVMQLWNDCKDYFDAIWVRYYAEDQDHDVMFSIDDNGKTDDRLCRYGFDHVRVTWLPTDVPPPSTVFGTGLGWKTKDNLWGLNTRGSYLAANFRGELCHDEPKLRPGVGTSTTSSCLMAGGLNWRYYDIRPTQLSDFIEQYHDNLRKVEFYWKRRLVRADVIHPDEPRWGWSFFSLDDWDNCLDPDYLNYVEDYALRRQSA